MVIGLRHMIGNSQNCLVAGTAGSQTGVPVKLVGKPQVMVRVGFTGITSRIARHSSATHLPLGAQSALHSYAARFSGGCPRRKRRMLQATASAMSE